MLIYIDCYVNDLLALHSSWILFRVRVKALKVVLGSIKEDLNLGGKVLPHTLHPRWRDGTQLSEFECASPSEREVRMCEKERQSKCIVYCLSQPGRVSTVKWCNAQFRPKIRWLKDKRMKLLIVFFIQWLCHLLLWLAGRQRFASATGQFGTSTSLHGTFFNSLQPLPNVWWI